MSDVAQPATAAPDVNMSEILEKAFDQTKPTYYANIYYVSGTIRDLRISFGTMRPTEHESIRLKVDKFDCSIIMTHALARELVTSIKNLIGEG